MTAPVQPSLLGVFSQLNSHYDQGKENLKNKYNLEQSVDGFDVALNEYSNEAKVIVAEESELDERDGLLQSEFLPGMSQGTVDAVSTAPFIMNAKYDVLHLSSDLAQKAQKSLDVNVAQMRIYNQPSLPSQKLTSVISELKKQSHIFKEVNFTVTESKDGLTVWIRDFNNRLKDIKDFICSLEEKCVDKKLPLKCVMVNGKQYKAY